MSIEISVLMGVYNAESYIVDAVQAILNQTWRDLELIICDDGSTDRTMELLKKLQQQDSRIILLQNEQNQGLAYGLNRCLQAAGGKYLARIDADDRCLPERFAVQHAFLEAHQEYDLVGCNMIMVDEHGNHTFSRVQHVPDAGCLPLDVPFLHPTVLMRRSVMDRLGGYKVEKYTRRCEDLELWYRFFSMGMVGYNLYDYLYIKAQGIDDYRRRKVIHGCEMFRIHLRGLRLLQAPLYRYPLAVKPIISAAAPKRLMMAYHSVKFRQSRADKPITVQLPEKE